VARKHRVKKADKDKDKERKQPKRWPWVVFCLLGIFLVCALGISTSKPKGDGLFLNFTLRAARSTATVAGTFSTYLCFLMVLTSIIKLAKPENRLPRSVWGLWTLLFFSASLWHDIMIPWENIFARAKMGAGGGLIGASLDWFFRMALGRIPALVIMALGIWAGLSLLFNKPAYAPFAVLWLGTISAWQWLKQALAEFFKEYGPPEEEIEYEALEELSKQRARLRKGSANGYGNSYEMSDKALATTEDALDSEEGFGRSQGFGTAIAQLRARLSQFESGQNVESESIEAKKAKSMKTSVKDDDLKSTRTSRKETQIGQIELPLNEDIFYKLPPLTILQKSKTQRTAKKALAVEERKRIIEKTLMSFGVTAKVVNVTRGPAVTRFELQPGPGVKVASIVSLSQDLALALAAQDVRIEAPIPGKSAVGIEVPNKKISLVHLRDVLETEKFRRSPSTLTVALGKDISGRPVVTTLDRCVHLLIAGATGAGKSVCINSIIASLLYKARPDQVKMLLIDPKRVELSVWSKIPHLIAPVVSDPKKAAGALRWAIKEMEARYEKFTKVGSRDIEQYNQIATPPDSIRPALPYIVIIIDELSDLMTIAPAEVEDAIFRLAQMARASGIYLVIATQRPSVDVLTGTIKANIPSRIAFAVSSQIDSRTILDMAGAEKLLGRGDMLFFPVGATKPLRAQGAYISEREIDELVSFVSSQAKPQFAPGVLSMPDTPSQQIEIQEDPLFTQAVRIVVEAKQASVSLLQRKLPIGYSRAARLIDAMESKGYIGPYEGSKPREVRLTMQDYLRLFENQVPKVSQPQIDESSDATTNASSQKLRKTVRGSRLQLNDRED